MNEQNAIGHILCNLVPMVSTIIHKIFAIFKGIRITSVNKIQPWHRQMNAFSMEIRVYVLASLSAPSLSYDNPYFRLISHFVIYVCCSFS